MQAGVCARIGRVGQAHIDVLARSANLSNTTTNRSHQAIKPSSEQTQAPQQLSEQALACEWAMRRCWSM